VADAPAVRTEVHGQVGEIVLDRPPLNLVTVAVLAELHAAVQQVQAAPDLRAVVVSQGSARAFCAGSDMREFAEVREDALERKIRPEHEVLSALAALPVPTVCALDGAALGGGLELALACDLRVASAPTVLGLPECRVGGLAGSGAQRLARLVGPGRAKELLFTGDTVGAEEALRIGLVNRVVPAGQAREAALDLAQQIARRAPHSVRAAKRLVEAALDLPLADSLALGVEAQQRTFATQDLLEGAAAFAARREPVFSGA
jgi:enoyl-CoA hydratase